MRQAFWLWLKSGHVKRAPCRLLIGVRGWERAGVRGTRRPDDDVDAVLTGLPLLPVSRPGDQQHRLQLRVHLRRQPQTLNAAPPTGACACRDEGWRTPARGPALGACDFLFTRSEQGLAWRVRSGVPGFHTNHVSMDRIAMA